MSGNNNSASETFKFQAEIQKVLDILINRLYKNRDIFLRELISNAADALNKFRIKRLENSENVFEPDTELKIHITFDEDENTLTVSDSGIGMTYQEAINNLGTIAQSGTLEFLEQMDKTQSNDTAMNLIGQFGVGFYSSFIVSNEVIVRSRSFNKDEKGIEWRSTGTGEFKVSYIDKNSRGTDVILQLKEDAKEFANKYKLETIIKKYSDFVGFPIRIAEDDKIINRQTPIWHQSPDEVEEKDYTEFYRQVSMDYTEPFHRIYVSVDAPIQFRALLFLPKQRNRMMLTAGYQDYGLRLYSKKILVQEKAKDLLPEYFRFVFGIVDSEDLPLNVSREVIQVDRNIKRISKSLTSKILDELEKVADNDEEKYLEWWDQFGVFLKEGITQDEKRRNKLLRQLRIKTSQNPDEYTTLDQYIAKMPEDQDAIYYLLGDNLATMKRSPHLEYYKKNKQNVILFSEPIDTFVMTNVTEYKEIKFIPIDQAEREKPKDEKDKETDELEEEEKEEEKDAFLSKVGEILGERVIDVRYTNLLTTSPCRLINPAGMGAFTRMLQYMNENFTPQKRILEINKEHPLIQNLMKLAETEDKSSLLPLCIYQLLEAQELSEGILQDPSDLIARNNELMQKIFEK